MPCQIIVQIALMFSNVARSRKTGLGIAVDFTDTVLNGYAGAIRTFNMWMKH